MVKDVAFQGPGCAISTASASVMTEALKGKTRGRGGGAVPHLPRPGDRQGRDADPERLGKLAVFAGVSEFPVRVKCATLCWHTARAALEGREEPVSTE